MDFLQMFFWLLLLAAALAVGGGVWTAIRQREVMARLVFKDCEDLAEGVFRAAWLLSAELNIPMVALDGGSRDGTPVVLERLQVNAFLAPRLAGEYPGGAEPLMVGPGAPREVVKEVRQYLHHLALNSDR